MDGYVVKRYPAWKEASSAGDRISKHFVAALGIGEIRKECLGDKEATGHSHHVTERAPPHG